MIEKQYLLSDEDGYKRYNLFEIDESLEALLSDDYYLFDTKEFEKIEEVNALYEQNFINNYDRETHTEIFNLYIDNESFQNKVKFIYSIIDSKKYAKFANENPEIDNPNEMTIKYSILDSEGVKVQIYYIGITDISFAF